jgi:hypothetical protein
MERTKESGEAKTPQMNALKKLEVYTSLINRALLATKIGEQYGGSRDIQEALGYPEIIQFEDYATRYARQDIARAVINRPVQHTWKGNVKLMEPGSTEETKLEKEWKKLDRELLLKSKFIRVDKLSSVGRYGALLLGFDDVKDQDGFKNPVREGKRKLLYVKPLSEGSAKINTYVKKTKDKRYGMVETYTVEYHNPEALDETMSMTVHHSRVIHITQELLESEIEGVPVLQSIWHRLMDLEKLVGGSAEMFWRGARPGYQAKVKPDYTLTTDVEAELQDQMDEFENNLRRILVNEGIDMEALAPQVSDPKSHVDVQVEMISAVTGIPKRILLGSERGELSSGQDIVGWYNVIQTRRLDHAETNIIRPFVDKMIEYQILPSPKGGEYRVEWEDLFAASDKDQAEVGRTRAMALREYSQNPTAEMIVPPEAFMRLMLGLDDDEVKLVQGMVVDNLEEELKAIREDTLDQNTPPEETGDDDVVGEDTKEVASKPVNANGAD